MRHIFVFLLFVLASSLGKTQPPPSLISVPSSGTPPKSNSEKLKQHASWSVSVVSTETAVGKTAELIIKADIEDGWYLYSSDFDPQLGPIVTSVKLKDSDSYKVAGNLTAVHPKKKFDEIWEGDITYFVDKAEFRQKVKILKENPIIQGTIEYQTCTIKDGACVAGEYDLNITVKTITASPSSNTKSETLALPKAVIEKNNSEKPNKITASESTTKDIADTTKSEANTYNKSAESELNKPSTPPPATQKASLWMFFVEAFLFGLAGLITPCVFPMVPMTVTFFTKTSKTHAQAVNKGFFYGFSIIFIYTVIGTLVAVFFGAEAPNFISTHWFPNIFFFVVFIVFAASFLGLFEIALPHWLVNKADEQSDKGGLLGIFFMAVTMAVVSFSCTGPIVSSVLIASSGGQFVKPIIGMLGFSLGFAIPFTLFAIFPSWLKSLPKSGGWLNSVKVSLGFLELALAFKFLSQADQVYQWGILDREIFLALWIVVFTLLGLYLVRKIKLSHDDVDYTEQPVSVPRIFFAVVSFSFVIYLVPGMFGAPLKALSGYLPPLSTADFVIGSEPASASSSGPTNTLCESPKHADLFHFPHGIKGYFDLEQAKACAKAENKPLLIDFTGRGCNNCREMEANVWSDPKVLKRLKEDFVVVSLYTDSRDELPKNEWYISPYDGKEKTTIGKQNTDLEIRIFENNAQPLYIIADADVKSWLEPRAYDRNIESYVKFLEEGKRKYGKQ